MSQRIALFAGKGEDKHVVAYTLVDNDTYALWGNKSWFSSNQTDDGYAIRNARGETVRSKATFCLHRLVMGLAPGDPREVEHLNGDKLDNRKCNLAIVTHSENLKLGAYRRKMIQAAADIGLNVSESAVRKSVAQELKRMRAAA